MKVTYYYIVIFVVCILSCQQKREKQPILHKPFSTSEIDKRVDSIIPTMTLDEKLAQIEGIRPNEVMENGKFSPKKAKETIPNGIGHFCQFASSLTMSRTHLMNIQTLMLLQT